MRSQASKTSPNKGAVNKTQLKSKRARKKTVAKKIKKVIRKPLVKGSKKNGSKNDKEAVEDKNESHLETRASTSKSNLAQSASSTKKVKKDPKEKKDPIKTTPDTVKKVNPKLPINKKHVKKPQPSAKQSDELKYKLNKDEPKKKTAKFSKVKAVIKKGKPGAVDKKDNIVQAKDNMIVDDKAPKDVDTEKTESKLSQKIEESNLKEDKKDVTKVEEIVELKETATSGLNSKPEKTLAKNTPITPKQEVERPPKFFTSSRSPRMVDIDAKCCKNSKGNLSVSDRLSLKCEVKSNEDKNVQNPLVSQGPEIDVYTFTEKVDSPKSILSDIRSPINQNIGRVRPIARVKGTVMEKKTETERKKFSPHRPIEEVVKQLKAKKSEEVSATQSKPSGSVDLNVNNDAKDVDAPKPIVSKSYKMVARKSSVTGIPFSPIKFPDQDVSPSSSEKADTRTNSPTKKTQVKTKKKIKTSSSDDELESSKFSFNTQSFQYSSSEEYDNNESNDDKESSTSDASVVKRLKNKRYKKITDSAKKSKSSELKELSKDSLVDLKDDPLGNKKKGKRSHHRPLHKYWKGPKKQRMALLNAKLVVQNLLANEFQTNMDLGLMKTVAMQPIPSTSKRPTPTKKKETKPKDSEKHETTSESEYENTAEKKEESSESSDDSRPQRTLREVPGIRSAGKYWDPKSCSSSSEDSELETKKKVIPEKKKIVKSPPVKSDCDKPPAKIKKTAPVKKKRNRNEVNMDFKDMVVQKRMASLNASAMIELSYEKRSPKSNKEETTTDSGSDESFSQKSKNGVSSGVKSESKNEEPKKEPESDDTIETDSKQKVEVIVNQDTDVTITGVYSTHHHHKEGGYCTVSGMQYRISSTSHTQTTATTNCEKEGCSRDDGARYTPLSALSSMQPPAEHAHTHPHPVAELGGLNRRAGCSSAFSAPSPSAHHDPDEKSVEVEEMEQVISVECPELDIPLEEAPEEGEDALIAEALGESLEEDDYSGEVHPNLASAMEVILEKGLSKTEKEKLSEIKIPNNCKLLEAPKLNVELTAVLTTPAKNRDKLLQDRQQELGQSAGHIAQAINVLSRRDFSKAEVIKKLGEASRLICNLHFQYTDIRRKLISPFLDKSLTENLKANRRGENLYTNLEESLKSFSAIKRASNVIKPRSAAGNKPTGNNNNTNNLKTSKNYQPPRRRYQNYQSKRGAYHQYTHHQNQKTYKSFDKRQQPGPSNRGRAKYP